MDKEIQNDDHKQQVTHSLMKEISEDSKRTEIILNPSTEAPRGFFETFTSVLPKRARKSTDKSTGGSNKTAKSATEQILDATSKITDIEVSEDLLSRYQNLTANSPDIKSLIDEAVNQVVINDTRHFNQNLLAEHVDLDLIDFVQALTEKRQKELLKLIEERSNCSKEKNTLEALKKRQGALSTTEENQYQALILRDKKLSIKLDIIEQYLAGYKYKLRGWFGMSALHNGHQYSARLYEYFNTKQDTPRLPVGEDWLFEKVNYESLKQAEKKLDDFYNKHDRVLSEDQSEPSKLQSQFAKLQSEFLKKRLRFDFNSQADFKCKLQVIDKVASTYESTSLEQVNHKIKLLEKLAEEIRKEEALNTKKMKAMDKEINAMKVELSISTSVFAESRAKLLKTNPLDESKIKKQQARVDENTNSTKGIKKALEKKEQLLLQLEVENLRIAESLESCLDQITGAKQEYLNRAKEKAKIDRTNSDDIFEKMLDGLDFTIVLDVDAMMRYQHLILEKSRDDALAELRKYDDNSLMGESTLWQRLGGSKAKKAFESFKKAQTELDVFNEASEYILSVNKKMVSNPIKGMNLPDKFNELLQTKIITTKEIFLPKDIEKSVKEARKNYVRALNDATLHFKFQEAAVQKAILDLREAQYAVYGKGQMTSYEYKKVDELKKRLGEINGHISKENEIDMYYEQALVATNLVGTSRDKQFFQGAMDERIQRLKTSFSQDAQADGLTGRENMDRFKEQIEFSRFMLIKDPYLVAKRKQLLTELTKIETDSAKFFFKKLARYQLLQESGGLVDKARALNAEERDSVIQVIEVVKSNHSYQERYLNPYRDSKFNKEKDKLQHQLQGLAPENNLASFSDFNGFFLHIQGELNPFVENRFIQAASAFDKLFFQKPDLIVEKDKAWKKFMETQDANKFLRLLAYCELVKNGKITQSRIDFQQTDYSKIDESFHHLKSRPEYTKLRNNLLKELKAAENSSSNNLKVTSSRQWFPSWGNNKSEQAVKDSSSGLIESTNSRAKKIKKES